MVSRRLTRQLVCWLLCLYAAALSIAAAAPVVLPATGHQATMGMHCHEQPSPVKQHHAACSDSCLLGCLLATAVGAPYAEMRIAGAACPAPLHGLLPPSQTALPAVALCAPLPPRGPPSLS
ncbi:hypothetical protein NX773_10645 [Massilia solisilvae]|uniref:DUF2946 domain-containing protein n=1 Tax=Massilia solisilvae TaxID=1811225 RepID=A0ABT2BJD3_9BURK|nr:hypothetical protein [Massilia solisilvae]MCS0608621.1 hypothetical protein [Massilia solisilvae]